MTTPVVGKAFERGDQIRSARFGLGRVEVDAGTTIIARFGHGIEECDKTGLVAVPTPLQAIRAGEWGSPLEVITRLQAEAIRSANDAWGIFTRARIALLPHQLWVCRRVVSQSPTRWLVADDVGLGKTIEAGLILWALLSKEALKRILVLCPASLVEQWQERLRTMFDIRLAQYATDADTARTDFWNTHNQVVASLHTLRGDPGGRHDRLFESARWDLLIVDEAHHLNADEAGGPTLAYKLVEHLVKENRVSSMVFFTGTPHRGKDFGFLSILELLRPELFDAKRPLREQLPLLREVMIRNNKQNVTDLEGRRLFRAPQVVSETYRYSQVEERFYTTLTEFIASGKTYASSLASSEGRAVMLVLIAMQKLASSSVAAIRRALEGRLARIARGRRQLQELTVSRDLLASYRDLEAAGETDAMSRLEEKLAHATAELKLMEDEEARLRELAALADEVKAETKIARIVSLVDERFAGRQVVLFTEYKATQALVMSALIRRFGEGCVTFINGDEAIDDVIDLRGVSQTLKEKRGEAARRFNTGKVRFLVSTEAGGEGIDLQEKCHSLIHIDLPWNPMRLHQRVGRLNRYGQLQQVEVISLRNPDTVESLIWEKLNTKLESIMLALGNVMDEPEDLMQLVLGMASPTLFREVFAEAESIPRDNLGEWFDGKTARFGGRDAIETVRDLVGHCNKFDFGQVSTELPPLDLPALKPFLVSALRLNGRQCREEAGRLGFKTPDAWLPEAGVRTNYEGLTFDRADDSSGTAGQLLGVGHKVIDQALRQARSGGASLAAVRADVLPGPLFAFRISERVTGEGGAVQAVVAGVEFTSNREEPGVLLRDWQVLDGLNTANTRPGGRARNSAGHPEAREVSGLLERATEQVQNALQALQVGFKFPSVEVVAVVWPMPIGSARNLEEQDGSEDAEDELQQ